MTFASEDKILAKKFKEDEIFPDSAPRIQYGSGKFQTQVPLEVLEFYSIGIEETEWVIPLARKAVERQRLVLGQLNQAVDAACRDFGVGTDSYFREKYPKFGKVVEKFHKYAPTSFISQAVLGAAQVKLVYKPVSLLERKENFLKQLGELIHKTIQDEIYEYRDKAYGSSPEDWKKSTQNRWQPLGPMPIVPSDGLSPKEAETHVGQILKFYGLEGVNKTRYSRDGGIDVESNTAVFQVKHQAAPVGVQVLREIFGVAAAEGKRAGVFAKTGFTKEALAFAEKTGIAVFRYIPNVRGMTPLSSHLLETGFSEFK
jgi:hypothetical protein